MGTTLSSSIGCLSTGSSVLWGFLQHNMPLWELYQMVLEHDVKVGNSAAETAGLLQQKEFYQVLSLDRFAGRLHGSIPET